MINILAVHGVATGPEVQVAREWESDLTESGLDCSVIDGRWGSTGGFVEDSIRFGIDGAFRSRAIESVSHALADFAQYRGELVVLAHSMGTVLALHAERLLRTRLPIVCLASPSSNPAISPALRAIGFGLPPLGGARVPHVWNDDDPIPGGGAASHPAFFDATRIAVADNEASRVDTEHDVSLYLSHPLTIDVIRSAAA